MRPARARVDQITALRDLLYEAHQHHTPVTLRVREGVGDASISDRGLVVDAAQMNRVLAWDPATGVMDLEPGVTIEDVWRSAARWLLACGRPWYDASDHGRLRGDEYP